VWSLSHQPGLDVEPDERKAGVVSDAVDTAATYDAAEELMDRRTPIQRLQSLLHQLPWISPMVVLLICVVVFGFLNSNFVKPGALSTIMAQTAVVGALAIGQGLIVLTAGIDLSVGAIMIFASMVMAKTAFENHLPGWLSLLLGIAVGIGAGLINGLLITRAKLPPFIVTLGTLGVFTSATLIYATGREVRNNELDPLLLQLGDGFKIGSFQVTYGVLVMLALYALFAYILRFTAWGRHVYAVGDDPDAARLAGIEVDRVLLSVYGVAGLIYGIGAWVLIGRVGSAGPNAGEGVNLDTITAVVIGGLSLFGGRGRIVGALIGGLIVSAVGLGLTLAQLDPSYKVGAIGLLIIGAVTADQWIRRARA
jgi:fructose transport system permease protein